MMNAFQLCNIAYGIYPVNIVNDCVGNFPENI